MAPLDELSNIIGGIGLDGDTHLQIHKALTQWRALSGEDLTQIALAVKDTGLRKWPAICTALLKLHEEGKEIPEFLVDSFILDVESPTYSSEWVSAPLRVLDENRRELVAYKANYIPFGIGSAVPRSQMIHQALAVLPDAAVQKIFERFLNGQYYKSYVAPYAYRIDNKEIWQRVIQVLDADTYGDTPRYTWEFVGNLGLKGLPVIEEALTRVNKKLRAGLEQGIVVALAQAASRHEAIPEEYDPYICFDQIPSGYDGKFLVPFFCAPDSSTSSRTGGAVVDCWTTIRTFCSCSWNDWIAPNTRCFGSRI